jgi:hypothetical protein
MVQTTVFVDRNLAAPLSSATAHGYWKEKGGAGDTEVLVDEGYFCSRAI